MDLDDPATPGELWTAGDAGLAPSDRLEDARAAVSRAEVAPEAERHRRQILGFLAEHPDALHRSCAPGHLTGSAVVLDSSGRHVVLLHHRKLGRWLQPGGHCDGDANLAGVALREASEETGLQGLAVLAAPVDLDVHEVDPPAEGPHLHLDVRYLVLAPPSVDPSVAPPGNHESTAIAWVPVDHLGGHVLDEGTIRMIDRAVGVRARLDRPAQNDGVEVPRR